MRRSEIAAWGLGLLGILGCGIGWAFAPASFHYAWLAALFIWLAWPLGSMAWLFVHALTGGRWGEAVRPALIAGVCTTPLVLLAIIPYLFSLRALYPWIDSHFSAILENGFYLNGTFFAWRGGIYVIAWLVLAVATLLCLRGAKPERAMSWLAPPGLIVLALTVTFAGIDATLALDPHFDSSIYGMITSAEFMLFALAIAAFATAPFITDVEILADIGKLLLALVALWTYFDFMQLLIVWESDLAHDSPWYIARTSNGWGIAATAIGICHFGLPFFILLSGRLQRSRFVIALVAGLLIAIAIVRSWWLVLPAAPGPLAAVGAIDLAPMLALGGIGSAVALWARRSALMPVAQHG